ncbi:MAG: hypothetical protein ACQERU_13640 [Bacteroidota bacterium]
MKRTGVVWVFTILIVLGIIIQLFGTYGTISGVAEVEFNTVTMIFIVINAVIMVLSAIMIYHWFMLKKSAAFWTHVSMGSALTVEVIRTIIFFATIGPMGTALVGPPSLLGIGISIFFWWAIVNYVNNKQVDGQPLFT